MASQDWRDGWFYAHLYATMIVLGDPSCPCVPSCFGHATLNVELGFTSVQLKDESTYAMAYSGFPERGRRSGMEFPHWGEKVMHRFRCSTQRKCRALKVAKLECVRFPFPSPFPFLSSHPLPCSPFPYPLLHSSLFIPREGRGNLAATVMSKSWHLCIQVMS